MAQQRAHDVHLRVAGAGVCSGSVDLLEDYRRLGDRQTTPAILLRDQRGEPSRFRQRPDERLGISSALLDLLPVLVVELTAQLANGLAIFLVLVCSGIDVGHQTVGSYVGAGFSRPSDASVGAGFSRPNHSNRFAMSGQRSSECSAVSAEGATSSPKRPATSAKHFRSSSSVDTGFSALPLG